MDVPDAPFGHIEYSQKSDIPYMHMDNLGHGSFGVVDSVQHISGVYARKTLRLGFGNIHERVKRVEREASIIKKLDHKHIIQVMATYQFKRVFCVIMRPVADMDLGEYLANMDALKKPERDSHSERLVRWFRCLTEAVAYIHKSKVRHKDLKPGNILVMGEEVVVTDFGIAKDTEGDLTTASVDTPEFRGAPLYQAPEVVTNERRGRASDIFSLGCVFLEMASVWLSKERNALDLLRGLLKTSEAGNKRNYAFNPDQIIRWLVYLLNTVQESQLPQSTGAIQRILAGIASMLDTYPEERPTAEELLALFYKLGPCCSNQSMISNCPWTPDCVGFPQNSIEDVQDFFRAGGEWKYFSRWPIERDAWLGRIYLAGRWRPREERKADQVENDINGFWVKAIHNYFHDGFRPPEAFHGNSGFLNHSRGYEFWVMGQRADGLLDCVCSMWGIRGWVLSDNCSKV